jgi:hypothetical protein
VPLQPSGETHKPRKEHPPGDAGLIELVADLPLEPRRADDPPIELGLACQPIVESHGVGSEITDKRASWLTIRPSMDGGSTKGAS